MLLVEYKFIYYVNIYSIVEDTNLYTYYEYY